MLWATLSEAASKRNSTRATSDCFLVHALASPSPQHTAAGRLGGWTVDGHGFAMTLRSHLPNVLVERRSLWPTPGTLLKLAAKPEP